MTAVKPGEQTPAADNGFSAMFYTTLLTIFGIGSAAATRMFMVGLYSIFRSQKPVTLGGGFFVADILCTISRLFPRCQMRQTDM